MGKRTIFNPLHICDHMQDLDNIHNAIGFNVEEPIHFNDSGINRKHINHGYGIH
jgi:hypothetical protein